MRKVNVLPVSFVGIALLRGGCDLAPSHPAESGDRPPDGSCPTDRPCSSSSTRLYFTGTPLGDALDSSSPPARAIAAGGTETIRVWSDRYASMPFLPVIPDGKGLCPNSDSNALAFCALPSGNTVGDDGKSILVIQSIAPPMVTVFGHTPAEDELNITASDGKVVGALYDKIPLDVRTPNTMRVVPADPDFRRVNFSLVDEMPIAFAVGSQPPAVVVAMYATVRGQAVRIVDEKLSLQPKPDLPLMTHPRWDSLVPSAPFGAVQDSSIMVTTQEQKFGPVTLKIVDTITRFTFASNTSVSSSAPLVEGNTYQVCVSAFHTDAMGTAWLVYGAKLVFTPNDSNIRVTPVPGPATSPFVNSCTYVQPTTAGEFAIFNVSYRGHTESFGFSVCPSTGCRGPERPGR